MFQTQISFQKQNKEISIAAHFLVVELFTKKCHFGAFLAVDSQLRVTLKKVYNCIGF